VHLRHSLPLLLIERRLAPRRPGASTEWLRQLSSELCSLYLTAAQMSGASSRHRICAAVKYSEHSSLCMTCKAHSGGRALYAWSPTPNAVAKEEGLTAAQMRCLLPAP